MMAMRLIGLAVIAAWLLVLALPVGLPSASAQTPEQPEPQAKAAATAHTATESCRPVPPGRIGLARTIEIDTSGGPRLGKQYNNTDFLHEREVVLTFDDGPSRRNSRMVLEALAEHCTKATFFMVGRMALADPGMVREIAARDHTIAIHTWSHRNLRAIGTDRAIAEFELGLSMVQRALGKPVAPFFRFPYLADSPAMLAHLAERNIASVSIDADSFDYRTRDPKRMHDRIIAELNKRGKGILLFHDIQNSTAHGIRGVLDELAAEGFKVVHLIAKTPAASVASYDDRANAEFARHAKLLAAFPMLERSVVWPMPPPDTPIDRLVRGLTASPKPEPNAAATVHRAQAVSLTPNAPQHGRAPRGQLPASQPGLTVRPAPESRPAIPRPTFGTDDNWQSRVFAQ